MSPVKNTEDKQMYGRPIAQKQPGYFMAAIVLISLAVLSSPTQAAVMDRTGTLWAPYVEWTLDNPSYSGNPFDLIATATFTHPASGETRSTEMFYTGGTTWKFRFAGTKTGEWTFTTASTDVELAGHTGTITINANTNPSISGFLVSSGNKFAKQMGENGELKSFILNIYMNHVDYDVNGKIGIYDTTTISNYLNNAQTMGFDTIFLSVLNNWFDINAVKHTEHTSTNPDARTFERLEELITTAHARGMHVHLWAWGDESRKWTQIGVTGGINGTADKRIQRYIAARLGPLPGWSMGYGFDLNEWVSVEQLDNWASYLKSHSGWPMMLGARRNESAGGGSALDYSSHGWNWEYYDGAVTTIDSNFNRPHLMSERDVYLRWTNMDGTRKKMWQYAMVGGHGGWWGLNFSNNTPYPNPEQLDAHRIFWQVNNRLLLDMSRNNSLSDGYVLKNSTNTNYIFYKENTSSINLNLSGMSSTQPVIVIDTKKAYLEIDLGQMGATNQTWTAPYTSDWAIAIGNFNDGTLIPSLPQAPTGERTSITIQ